MTRVFCMAKVVDGSAYSGLYRQVVHGPAYSGLYRQVVHGPAYSGLYRQVVHGPAYSGLYRQVVHGPAYSGLYRQVVLGPAYSGLYRQVVLLYRWSLRQAWVNCTHTRSSPGQSFNISSQHQYQSKTDKTIITILNSWYVYRIRNISAFF